MSKRIIVIPDMQVPSEDRKFVAALTDFVADYQPDELFCVGDEADSPEPSRWARGTAEEYSGTLQAGLDRVHEVMAGFRNAIGDKPFHVMRSNHNDRIATYVKRYGPALSSLRSLDIESLLGYDALGITYHRRMYEFAPGWVMAHGDEGNLVQTPGGTALSLSKKIGKSVICGHTHRAGIQSYTEGFHGKPTRTLTGIEVGHAMDTTKAGYVKAAANWQQAFGVLHVDDRKRVHPTLVMVQGRSFIVDGDTWSW